MTATLTRPAPVPPAARRSRTARLRPAVRIAWRDIRRSPGRSALVIALIALPVFALSAADVLARTMQLSTVEQVHRQVGNSAALIADPPATTGPSVEQSPDGLNSFGGNAPASGSTRPGAVIDAAFLAAHLPAGARLIETSGSKWTIATRYGITTTEVQDDDYGNHVFTPLLDAVLGRRPTGPGEVALTPSLARRIGRGVGDAIVNTATKVRYTVVGIVADRFDPVAQTAYVAPGTIGTLGLAATWITHDYYIDSAAPVTWPMIVALNRVGVTVVSTYVAAHPPARAEVPFYRSGNSSPGASAAGITTATLLSGMVVLEIVLLAGPAFAVGARRMRRTMGLIGAVGGSRRDLRNVVLAGGVILGSAAGLVGSVLGIATGLALVPAYAHGSNVVAGPVDLRAIELLGIVGVSVLTGLLASWVPARQAARTDILGALRGRRGTVRTRVITPLFGAMAAVAGALVAMVGAAATRDRTLLLVGVIMAELGLIACTPALIGWIGRGARWLPLSARIALRDTVRNRSAAASAVAAILAAVTGGVAVSILVASIDRHDRAGYQQSLPMHYGYVDVSPGNLAGGTRVADVVQALQRVLPGRSVAAISGSTPLVGGNHIYAWPVLRPDPEHPVIFGGQLNWPAIIVDDGRTVDAISGRANPAAAAALRAGKAVVFSSLAITDGYLSVDISTSTPSGNASDKSRRVPAVLAPSTFTRRDAIIPPSIAARWGLRTAPVGVIVAGSTSPTSQQAQAAQAALSRLGIAGGLHVENGYRDQYRVGLVALLGASSFIALAAAMIATALATVDSRPDLQTLAAVGASPRVRRQLSGARAGVIAGIGCVLGVACGFVAPIGYLGVQNALAARNGDMSRYPITIPWWPNIIGVLVVLPLLAAAGGYLFSRSRLPSERSRAT